MRLERELGLERRRVPPQGAELPGPVRRHGTGRLADIVPYPLTGARVQRRPNAARMPKNGNRVKPRPSQVRPPVLPQLANTVSAWAVPAGSEAS